MGEVSRTTMRRRKKKGRPSLLDLQKRVLKQQKLQEQQQQNPIGYDLSSNPRRLSPGQDHYSHSETRCIPGGDHDDDEDERAEKKHKLLLGLTSHQNYYPTLSAYSFLNSTSNGSDSIVYGEDTEAALKRRKMAAVHCGSYEVTENAMKATDTVQGSQVESGPTTTLPDKKLLVFILDRLQKKDTHGVFSEPVDPEELPDYHDIIESPMDFGTVRAKLDGGAYTNLEQFEEDIFLICSNAMKYNAPDTVFYRQARSMQELAKKDFENLRTDSDDDGDDDDDSEPEQKVARRGRPPGKTRNRFPGNPEECIGAKSVPSATLASEQEDSKSVNGYNLRRARSSLRSSLVDPMRRTSTSQHGETLTSWVPEWKNEFPASVLKSVLKGGKNDNIVVDENRRDSYIHSLSSGNSPFASLDGEIKQLLPVGLHVEHGYARSLAMFAAGLGPVVRKIASKKIRSLGQEELGSVWQQEYEMLQQQQQQSLLSLDRRSSDDTRVHDSINRLLCKSTTGPDIIRLSNSIKHTQDAEIRERNSQSETISLDKSKPEDGITPNLLKEQNTVIPSKISGLNGQFGPHFPQEMRMVRLDEIMGVSCSVDSSAPSHVQCTSTAHYPDSSRIPAQDIMDSNKAQMAWSPDKSQCSHSAAVVYGEEPIKSAEVKARWQGMPSHHALDSISSFNPDLNVGLGFSVSPNSNLQILSQMQQPDLVLQL